MNDSRKEMNRALESTVAPFLKEIGFKGRYPHYFRQKGGHVDLLTFEFSQFAAGSFRVEISYKDKNNVNISPSLEKTNIDDSKYRVRHTLDRFRLGAKTEDSDYEFEFAKYAFAGKNSLNNYQTLAQSVITLLKTQGEAWWEKNRIKS